MYTLAGKILKNFQITFYGLCIKSRYGNTFIVIRPVRPMEIRQTLDRTPENEGAFLSSVYISLGCSLNSNDTFLYSTENKTPSMHVASLRVRYLFFYTKTSNGKHLKENAEL